MFRAVFALFLVINTALWAGDIEGLAVDHEGNPFPNVRLELHRLTWPAGQTLAESEVVDVTMSDGEGRFVFVNADDSAVYRILSPADLYHCVGWHLPVRVGEGPYEIGITNRYSMAMGQILEYDGFPIEGAKVWRRFTQTIPGEGRVTTLMCSAESDELGIFSLGPVIEPSSVPVEIELPDGHTFTAAIEAELIEEHSYEPTVITCAERKEGVIRIVDAHGEPVDGVLIGLSQMSSAGGARNVGTLTTSSSGEQTVLNLLPGRYSAQLRSTTHSRSGLFFDVEEESTPEIEITFLGTGQITGRLLTPGGSPLAGMRVQARSDLGEEGSHETTVLTDEAGHFVIADLPFGTWEVRPWGGESAEITWTDGVPTVTLTEDNPVMEVTGLPEINPVGTYTITGHVLSPSGSGVEGVEVRLIPADANRLARNTHHGLGGLIDRTQDQTPVVTDARGKYEITTSLRPGAIAGICATDDEGQLGIFDLQSTRQHRWTRSTILEPKDLTLREMMTVEGQIHGDLTTQISAPNLSLQREVHFRVNQAQTEWWMAQEEEQGRAHNDEDTLTGQLFFHSALADEEGHFTVELPRATPWVATLGMNRVGWVNEIDFVTPGQGDLEPLQLGELLVTE